MLTKLVDKHLKKHLYNRVQIRPCYLVVSLCCQQVLTTTSTPTSETFKNFYKITCKSG